MVPTTLTLHSAFQVGEVDERVFGGFMEHLGRCVYEGLYDPGNPLADQEGFREDVMAALRRLRMTAMRYPGGNFASGYHWQDGVGPKDRRPPVYELAWRSLETNQFGTDEYVRLCRKMDWMPMITVNLGSGTPEEARNWVEYCNRPAGTLYANLRTANGSKEPYGVNLWCLGNEMDGKWQLGHVPADQYAIRAQQAAKMMKDVDPTIQVVVCGSCGVGMPTYMEWDRQVLDALGDFADHISLHRYVGNSGGNTEDFLAVTNAVDRQIDEMDAACRFIQAKHRSRKRIGLCFDEWNVWYRNHQGDGQGKFAPPLLEEVYNLEDALVVAGFLNSFIRHADRVKIANLAQIVNVIGPVLTRRDSLLLQSIFYPFEMISARRKGVSLVPKVAGPVYESKSHGPTPYLDASAILDADTLSIFAVNRSSKEAMPLRVCLADRPLRSLASGEMLTGPEARVANSFESPHQVEARPLRDVAFHEGMACLELPPLSLAAVSLSAGK